MIDFDDDDGLPNEAFTELELAAGVQHIMRGTREPERHLPDHSESKLKEGPNFRFTTFSEARNWAKEGNGRTFSRANDGQGFVAVKFGRLPQVAPINTRLDDRIYDFLPIFQKDDLDILAKDISYMNVGGLYVSTVRRILAKRNEQDLQKIVSLLELRIKKKEFEPFSFGPNRVGSDSPEYYHKARYEAISVLAEAKSALEFKRTFAPGPFSHHDCDSVLFQGSIVRKGGENWATQLNPNWRGMVRSEDFNEFTHLSFFYWKIGYTRIGTIDTESTMVVLRSGEGAQIRKLRARLYRLAAMPRLYGHTGFPDLYQSRVCGKTQGEVEATLVQHQIDFRQIIQLIDSL